MSMSYSKKEASLVESHFVFYTLSVSVLDRLNENKVVPTPYTPSMLKSVKEELQSINFEYFMKVVPTRVCKLLGGHKKIPVESTLLSVKFPEDASVVNISHLLDDQKDIYVSAKDVWRAVEGDLSDGWGEGYEQSDGFGEEVTDVNGDGKYVRLRSVKNRASISSDAIVRRYMLDFQFKTLHTNTRITVSNESSPQPAASK